jgi:hypothetical protein
MKYRRVVDFNTGKICIVEGELLQDKNYSVLYDLPKPLRDGQRTDKKLNGKVKIRKVDYTY